MQKVIGTAEKQFESSFEGYWLGTMHSASKLIENITDDYKLKVLKRMIPFNPEYLNPEDPHFHTLPNDLIVSVKRDGGFNTLTYDISTRPLSVFTNSPGGRILYNLPVNREIEERIEEINSELLPKIKALLKNYNKSQVFAEKNKIESIILGGELFANIVRKGDRPRVFDYIKLSRNPDSKDDLDKLYYEVFDILSINEVDFTDISYEFRIDLVDLFFPRTSEAKAKVIIYKKDVKAKDVQNLYHQWVEEQNHEGLVIRTKYNMSYKVKPRFDIDAAIIGFSELLAEQRINGEDGISSLLIAVMRDDGSFQELGHVGSGFTEDQRVDFYKLLKQDIVKSKYMATKRDGRAYHFVKPKYVIQVIYTDIIEEATSGQKIYRMALKYEDDQWKTIHSVPFVSIIHPRFELLRSEVDLNIYPSLEYANIKEVTHLDVNINQVSSIVPIESAEIQETTRQLPQCTMLLQLSLEGKWAGVLSAKKLLFWATNKHEINPLYPNYVVYFVDYSYARSDPLQQDIYPFNNLEKAIQHINWIFRRPDNANEALVDKDGLHLKKSIVAKPFKIELNEEIKPILEQYLDNIIKGLIF